MAEMAMANLTFVSFSLVESQTVSSKIGGTWALETFLAFQNYSVSNRSKSETATFGAQTRQNPPQNILPKTATILAQTATILEIFKYSFYRSV